MRCFALCALAGTVACRAAPAPRDTPKGPSSPAPVASAVAEPQEPATVAESFDDVAQRALDEHLAAHPTAAVEVGLHAFDGKLPDVTPAGLTGTTSQTAEAIASLERFDPTQLTNRQRAELAALLTTLEESRFRIEVLEEPFRNPMFYTGLLDLTPYISRPYAPLEQRADAVAAFAEAVPPYLKAAKTNLRRELPRTFVETALLQARGTAAFVRSDVPAAMADLPAGVRRDRLQSALEAMALSLDGFAAYLEKAKALATDDFALGPTVFARMLETTQGIDIDLGVLESAIRADLERNLAALDTAAKAISPRRSTASVVARVQRDKPAAHRVLAEATAQANTMKSFLREHKLVTIPSDDEARVVETPPFMRWNAAFLSSAGVFETKPLPSFYYISPPDPSWPKTKQRDYIPGRTDLLFITIHEVWPGHFLHSLHLKQNDSRILKALWNYATGEGWAHYTEEMMWDAGISDDPAVHIGQLQNALLRDVRSLCAIGLHTQGMTVETCQAMFVDKAFQSEGNAEQEARRGTFDPMYLAYTTGKLILLQLRRDLEARAEADGKPFDARGFHDAVLSYGAAPLSAIRAALVPEDPRPLL